MKKFRILAVSILSLMMVLACFALPGCFEPEPEPEPEPPVKYTVTFNLNYSGAPAATTAQVESGSKAQKPADPTRSGYTFDGWFDNANGTGTAFDFNTAITANKTLYAKWTQQTFTVTFNLNYTGAPAATTQQVASGGSVQKPTDPSRTGYTFNGWFRAASGGTAVTFPLTITAATTLYAQWTQQGTDPSPTDPSPSVTPTPTGGLTGSLVTDVHQNTTEKDASWTRYTMHVRPEPGVGSGFASYVACSITGSDPGGEDADGYHGVGGFRTATDATITFTFNASAACEVGLYVEVSQYTAANMLGTLYGMSINGTNIDVTNVALVVGDADNTCSNKYIFVSYINLKAGENKVVVTRNATSPTSGAFNWWGIRLTAQSATITA